MTIIKSGTKVAGAALIWLGGKLRKYFDFLMIFLLIGIWNTFNGYVALGLVVLCYLLRMYLLHKEALGMTWDGMETAIYGKPYSMLSPEERIAWKKKKKRWVWRS